MDRSSFYSNFRHQIVFGAERLLNGIQHLLVMRTKGAYSLQHAFLHLPSHL